MSRTRMIKPSFFKHADLYAAEVESGLPLRIAFAGLWTVTDRAGRFKWKPDLKPDVLPYDAVDMLDVLNALERGGFVRRYLVAGKAYGMIPSFSDHQTFHKTERGSTLPAPVVNGGSPVRHTADTVTVAGTVTEFAADDLAAIQEIQQNGVSVPPEPELTALFLAICANTAVTEKWGESPSPYTPANAASLYDVLRAAGVPPELARLSFYRQCRESNAPKPPRSINYFRPGIEDDWTSEQTRRAVAASREVPPSLEETRRTPAGTAPRRTSVRDTGRATVLAGRIRGLITEHQQPGQALRRSIPSAAVKALGDDVFAAYETIGGATRFLDAQGADFSFVIRDFTAALEASHA